MGEYLLVVISFDAHLRGADEAKPDTVPPSGASQDESTRDAFSYIFFIHDERRTVQVGVGERPADFQLFPDGVGTVRPNDFQQINAPGRPAAEGNEVQHLPEIDAAFAVEPLAEFLLRVGDFPAIEIGRVQIAGVEHLLEKSRIRLLTERFGRGTNPLLRRFFLRQVGKVTFPVISQCI